MQKLGIYILFNCQMVSLSHAVMDAMFSDESK